MSGSQYLDDKGAYEGPERRASRRCNLNYPISIRLSSPSGAKRERYSKTKNVSSGGVLFEYSETVSPGAEVDIAIAVPSTHSDLLPPTQLNAACVVVRAEPTRGASYGSGVNVALRFLGKPTLSMKVTMFG